MQQTATLLVTHATSSSGSYFFCPAHAVSLPAAVLPARVHLFFCQLPGLRAASYSWNYAAALFLLPAVLLHHSQITATALPATYCPGSCQPEALLHLQ